MERKAAISLATGLEDPEKVTIAFLMALGAAESGRPTVMFLTKEAARLAIRGVAVGTCDGCPSLESLMERFERAGGRFFVCPICFGAKKLDEAQLVPNAQLNGTIQLWEWIGDGATTFSF